MKHAMGTAAAVLLASIAGAPSARAEKVLRVNVVADPAMIDPITNSELVAGVVMKPMYEGFIMVDEKGGVVNALATSWNFSADNKTVTFKLRPGVKFTSGRTFGAKDVKYTFEETLRPGSRGGLVAPYLANIAGAKEFSDGKAQEVAGIRVVDPLTVEITLVKPDVLFPIYPFQFMDSGIAAEQGPEWMTKVSAGTGPYSFVRWQRGVEVAEKANPNYWGGAPKIDGIRFLIVPSGDTALSMYEAGELDVVDVPESSYRRALNDEAKQNYDLTVANYRQTVLTAFQQVEDDLAALRILEEEAKVQEVAVVVAAQRSLDLSNTRYEGGVTSYLEVITAQNAALADEVTAVNILGRRMANAVLLIQALGGGWDKSSLPARPECCGKLISNRD